MFIARLSWSPIRVRMSRVEILTNGICTTRSRNGSGLMPCASRSASSFSTAGLLGASTQPRRRSTVKGRIDPAILLRLVVAAQKVGTDHIRAERDPWLFEDGASRFEGCESATARGGGGKGFSGGISAGTPGIRAEQPLFCKFPRGVSFGSIAQASMVR